MTDTNEVGASTIRPPRENLFRAQPALELTRDQETGRAVLEGHFAVTNQWAEINSLYEGRFMERFAPGAFKKTITESRDQMRVLFQHGRDPQIGDKPLGPITGLGEDDYGVRYTVPLLDTDYVRELLPGLEAGLYGASFRFMVMKEEYVEKPKRSAHNPEGIAERTVTEAQVREFGPVTFPAYKGATAGVRSTTDEFVLGRMLDDPDRLLELISLLKNRAELVSVDLSESPSALAAVRDAADAEFPEPDPSEGTTPNETNGLRNDHIEVEAFVDGEKIAEAVHKNTLKAQRRVAQTGKPEPSAATTPRATPTVTTTVGLYIPNLGKEKPRWLL